MQHFPADAPAEVTSRFVLLVPIIRSTPYSFCLCLPTEESLSPVPPPTSCEYASTNDNSSTKDYLHTAEQF